MRIADEQHMVESFDNAAEVVGAEKFYLKVGEMLHKKGLANVGLFPDGQVVHSEDEHIEAQRVFEERIQTKEYHESHVFNPSLGELGSMLGQVSEFNKIRSSFMTQRLSEGASMKQAREEAREIDENVVKDIQETKQKVIENRKQTQERIEEIIPEQKVSEDRLENLYEAIYSEQTTPQKLVEFIGEMRSSEAKEQQLIAEQKARIAESQTLGAKTKGFIDNYAEREIAQTQREIDAAVNVTPFARSIIDAEAQYEAGAMSGKEASVYALREIASDALVMAVTLGIIKGGTSAVRAGGKAIWKAVTKTPVSASYAEKFGIKIQRTLDSEAIGLDLNAPNKFEIGEKIENSVATLFESQGFEQTSKTFPGIDLFNRTTGHGTSVKYMDITMQSRINNPSTIRYTLNRYNRKLDKFDGGRVNDWLVSQEEIGSKDTILVLREGSTQEQWNELARSITEWNSKGIPTHVWTIK
jgi:hypothetical protein